MTMADALDAVVTALRTSFGTTPVEEFWRTEPPAVLTVYATPRNETAERGRTIGNVWQQEYGVDVIVETPWDNTVATGLAVLAAVETVKAYVHGDRDMGGEAEVARAGAIDYQFVGRGSQGLPTYSARIPLLFTWSHSE